jgi:hypothetical protein
MTVLPLALALSAGRCDKGPLDGGGATGGASADDGGPAPAAVAGTAAPDTVAGTAAPDADALLEPGETLCWGENAFGVLGDDPMTFTRTPQLVRW